MPDQSNRAEVSDELFGDGALRGIHRVAAAEPEKPWAGQVVAKLAAELIRLRGTDRTWISLHPEEIDPQAHVDALLKAGVLHQDGVGRGWYRVNEPHAHVWFVADHRPDPGPLVSLRVECECGEVEYVQNRLPIEVPHA